MMVEAYDRLWNVSYAMTRNWVSMKQWEEAEEHTQSENSPKSEMIESDVDFIAKLHRSAIMEDK